jgi:glycogen debranching enzyme
MEKSYSDFTEFLEEEIFERWKLSLYFCKMKTLMLPGIPADWPILVFGKETTQKNLGRLYCSALKNLLLNTVKCDPREYNSTGLVSNPPGLMIRAGGDYHTPWTRDASINSWNAASLLEPSVARNTLWAVCRKETDGTICIQKDKQWWDKVIWVTGAWSHYVITGDLEFLRQAYNTSIEGLREMEQEHFDNEYGLFQGPSFYNDGISAYPSPPFDPRLSNDFVLDHPATKTIMTLSTNCVYYNAYVCAGRMAACLGMTQAADELAHRAGRLKQVINQRFWIPQKGRYGFLVHGSGTERGTLDPSQEGTGHAFAILFGVADAEKTQSIFQNVHLEPRGITDVWPHLPRYNDEHPGRHNVTVWPMVNGFWADAAATGGNIALFRQEVENIAQSVSDSDDNFYEIYNSMTGAVDGGWQSDRHWESCTHQTWSATAFLRTLFYGMFGFDFEANGLRFKPSLPETWGNANLHGLKYRDMILDITLNGEGSEITKFIVDGKIRGMPFISSQEQGEHTIEITVKS